MQYSRYYFYKYLIIFFSCYNTQAYLLIPNIKEVKFLSPTFFCPSLSNYRTMESFLHLDLYIIRAYTN
jgi:hypothetical protein